MITSAGTATTITQAGTVSTIYSLTTDGSNYYFINGTKVHKGSVGASPADSEIYNTPGVTRATIRFVKQRLLLAIGNVLYELNANATGSAALPTALYTHKVRASYLRPKDKPERHKPESKLLPTP